MANEYGVCADEAEERRERGGHVRASSSISFDMWLTALAALGISPSIYTNCSNVSTTSPSLTLSRNLAYLVRLAVDPGCLNVKNDEVERHAFNFASAFLWSLLSRPLFLLVVFLEALVGSAGIHFGKVHLVDIHLRACFVCEPNHESAPTLIDIDDLYVRDGHHVSVVVPINEALLDRQAKLLEICPACDLR